MPSAAPELAVVLAGGLGTRIRHLLQGLPKPLAPVAGAPFLAWIVRYLHAQGLRRVVLSAGYGGEQVARFATEFTLPGLHLQTVIEPQPRGTAGGFVHAWRQLQPRAERVLVTNGDSLALVPLTPLFEAMRVDDAAALLAVQVDDASRYGTLEVDVEWRLSGFREKHPARVPGLVNAGVYLLERATADELPTGEVPLSFETDVFPALAAGPRPVRVAPARGAFLDIGTEASLAQAERFIRDNPQWFHPSP